MIRLPFQARFQTPPHPYLRVILISLLPILILYIPFIFQLKHIFFLTVHDTGFVNILRNWDGPHYIVIARTFYDIPAIEKLLFTSIPATYYPAHFPLYPLAISLVAPVLGYFHAGLAVNLLFGVLLNILFYTVAKKHTNHPLFLTLVFTLFPGRFFITRAILAPETMMVFFMLLALVLWEERKYFSSSVYGSLGMLSKVKAGFLFPAFMAERIEAYLLHRHRVDMRALWSVMIPLTFGGLCLYYYFQTGDFFAFFNAEKGNNLFVTFPFAQFNSASVWAGTAWLEDVVFYFAGMFALLMTLAQSKTNRSWFYFVLFYSAFLVFVPQRDITRFAYPMYPLFLLTFEKFFTSKAWKYAFILLIPAIYLYTWNFILQNQAPIANLAPFL